MHPVSGLGCDTAACPPNSPLNALAVFVSVSRVLDLWIFQGIRSEDRTFTEGFAPSAEIFYGTRVTVGTIPLAVLLCYLLVHSCWLPFTQLAVEPTISSLRLYISARAVCMARAVSEEGADNHCRTLNRLKGVVDSDEYARRKGNELSSKEKRYVAATYIYLHLCRVGNADVFREKF